MNVRVADRAAYVESVGARIHYEVFGHARPTILLLPTWTIIHRRFWKAQVPFLARHFEVVTYDGPGNGHSGRPLDSGAYDHDTQVAHALAVLDAAGTERAVVVGLSMAAAWALDLAANHSDRVLGTVLIGASLPVAPPNADRDAAGWHGLPPSAVPRVDSDGAAHWAKYDIEYWQKDYEDFLWFFFGRCFTEPHSTKQIEDCVGWGRDTAADVLIAEAGSAAPDQAAVRDWSHRMPGPLLAIHGTDDDVSPYRRSEVVAELSGGELVLMGGSGHVPLARDPVKVNLLIREFAGRFRE
jgi:pimeloyl-ACP methyl ester carboxylesterase